MVTLQKYWTRFNKMYLFAFLSIVSDLIARLSQKVAVRATFFT